MGKSQIKEIIITAMILWILLFILSGCSYISITHRDGELPDISIERMEKFCDYDFDTDIDSNGVIFTCAMKL